MQPTGGQSIALRKRSFMPVQQLQKGEKLYLEMQVAHAGAQLSGGFKLHYLKYSTRTIPHGATAGEVVSVGSL